MWQAQLSTRIRGRQLTSQRSLQTIALEAIERQRLGAHSPLVFTAERGGYLDRHNFRNREWKPAQGAAGIEPLRRIYDLRHTFATFALRAGISTFDLSRYMVDSMPSLASDARDAGPVERVTAWRLPSTPTVMGYRRPGVHARST